MKPEWKRWEGQVVNGEFHLRRYVGGSDHSAVFVTERSAQQQKASIKLVPADPQDADLQLSRWKGLGNCRIRIYFAFFRQDGASWEVAPYSTL